MYNRASLRSFSEFLVMHDINDLISIFDQCFFQEFNTLLQGGAEEPIYLPADKQTPHHRIMFSYDYFASALHEIAHWCVAGEERRGQVDYGYWYEPDGRSVDQQVEFERVEVKPQALEWLLAEAAGRKFRVSADNLSLRLGASDAFKADIALQARSYCKNGIPERPKRLIHALQAHYGTVNTCSSTLYNTRFLLNESFENCCG